MVVIVWLKRHFETSTSPTEIHRRIELGQSEFYQRFGIVLH